MTARIKISQAGLSAGVAGLSRTDGLATGALVTLEDVSGAGLSTFHLLWGPPEDTTAEASLAATGDPDIWTFSPTAATYGSYEIELRESGVPVERRVFGVRTPANHLLIPALNERASRHAGWDNDGADQIDACEQNANDFPLTVLNSFRYAGWWRSLYELYKVVEAGVGGIADHALALIKLVTISPKSFLANASNATGNVSTLAGTAAYQYPRVNAANNALEMATLSAHGSISVPYDAASNTFQREAATGAVTSAKNSTSFAFGQLAAKSLLGNPTNTAAVPVAFSGGAAMQYCRMNNANTGLEFAPLYLASVAAATSLTNSTTLLVVSGTATLSPTPNPLVVGSKLTLRGSVKFARGSTATPLDLACRLEISGGTVIQANITPTSTANGFSGYVDFEAHFFVLTTGATGTAAGYVAARSNALASNAFQYVANNNASFTIDTTASIDVRLVVGMSAAVANCTLTCMGGDVVRVA